MDEYLSKIERLDLDDSPDFVNNSSTDHAIPLVARLIARGRKEICMVTGSLNPKIYADKLVIDALGVFLVGRSGKMRVLIQQGAEQVPDSEISSGVGGLVEKLKSEFGASALKNISIGRASDAVRTSVEHHFLVVDAKGFRFEPDNTKHEAVASFNQPTLGEKLAKVFEHYIEGSAPLAIA